jgi:hypothetical protein
MLNGAWNIRPAAIDDALAIAEVQELVTRGFGSMAVWLLDRNPSRKFYERLGGTLVGRQEIERRGATFIEVAYGWESLNVFFKSRE